MPRSDTWTARLRLTGWCRLASGMIRYRLSRRPAPLIDEETETPVTRPGATAWPRAHSTCRVNEFAPTSLSLIRPLLRRQPKDARLVRGARANHQVDGWFISPPQQLPRLSRGDHSSLGSGELGGPRVHRSPGHPAGVAPLLCRPGWTCRRISRCRSDYHLCPASDVPPMPEHLPATPTIQ